MGRSGRPVMVGSLLFVLVSVPALARVDSLDTLTEKLIALRSEVEELSNQLNLAREEQKQRMKFLYARRGELEADLKRNRLQRQKLEKTLNEQQAQVRRAGADGAALKPVLLEAIDTLSMEIRQGLPFKPEQRLAELDELRTQLSTDVIPAQRAANRFWSFYEDEFLLSRENGVYRQIIKLDGEERLVDVARVGMVMLFFRTDEGEYGYAHRMKEGEWQFSLFESGSDSDRIAALFDSMEKQIRSGVFEIPNTLASDEIKTVSAMQAGGGL